jgi:hypothetical protein
MQKLILYSLFLISYLSQGQATGTATIVVEKAVSYGTTAINIPAFTATATSMIHLKKTYIRLRADDTSF